MQYLGVVSKMTEHLCSFPKPAIQYQSNPRICPTTNVKEAEIEQLYEDLQDLLQLTLKKDVLFIIGD